MTPVGFGVKRRVEPCDCDTTDGLPDNAKLSKLTRLKLPQREVATEEVAAFDDQLDRFPDDQED